jgi:2,4-dienoyl-CoA reductase-like NADH-dependent reductase (Old Yellow Enzyme family)
MKTVFDQTHLAGIKLKNRFFRSATYEGLTNEQGHVTEKLLHVYENLAKGGVGTIITGLTNVTDVEKFMSGQMQIYNDSFIDEYQKLTDIVHKHDANIIVQLVCNGAQNASTADGLLWAPSAVTDLVLQTVPKEMTKDDIHSMQDAFAAGAVRAKKAGFDGIQIHAAHGYLLSRFLTPYYNRRKDEYGGSLENRARAVLETYQRIREAVGVEFPVLVKINCDDFMDQGMTFEECKYVCKMLEKAGVSAIEISGGLASSRHNEGTIRNITPETESYFKQYAAEIAEETDIPVLLVGGNRDLNKLTDIINQTEMEYISLSRPFIREPELINRWISGDRTPAKCISCTKCFTNYLQFNDEIKCIFNH